MSSHGGGGRFSLLAGIHDMNSEFAYSENRILFMNSAFSLTPSMVNSVPMPTYPFPGIGTRMKWAVSDRFSILAAAYGGDPGDSTMNPHIADLTWNDKRGTFTVVETQTAYELWPKSKNFPA